MMTLRPMARHVLDRRGVRDDHLRGRRIPPRDSDPLEAVLGAQEIFTAVNPYGKYLLGPGNVLGGANRERRLPCSTPCTALRSSALAS
jgi:hypothetical protein